MKTLTSRLQITHTHLAPTTATAAVALMRRYLIAIRLVLLVCGSPIRLSTKDESVHIPAVISSPNIVDASSETFIIFLLERCEASVIPTLLSPPLLL